MSVALILHCKSFDQVRCKQIDECSRKKSPSPIKEHSVLWSNGLRSLRSKVHILYVQTSEFGMMRRDSPNWSPDVSDEQVLSKIEDLELLSPLPSPFAQMRGYTFISPLSSADLPEKRSITSLSDRDIQKSKIIEQVRKFNQHTNVSDDFSQSLLPAERIRSQSSMSSVLLSPRIQPGSLSSIFASPRRQTLRPLSGRSSTESSFDELDTTFSPDILSGRSSGIQTNDPEIGSSSDLYSEETEVAVVPEEDLTGKN